MQLIDKKLLTELDIMLQILNLELRQKKFVC